MDLSWDLDFLGAEFSAVQCPTESSDLLSVSLDVSWVPEAICSALCADSGRQGLSTSQVAAVSLFGVAVAGIGGRIAVIT